MSTIEEIVKNDALTEDEAVAALVAREQAAVDTLQEVAMKFNLMPAVVAKVIQHLGLGEPPSDEMREYVDRQYDLLVETVKENRVKAIEVYRERGMIVEIPEFVDPLGAAAPEALVIPDTPEG